MSRRRKHSGGNVPTAGLATAAAEVRSGPAVFVEPNLDEVDAADQEDVEPGAAVELPTTDEQIDDPIDPAGFIGWFPPPIEPSASEVLPETQRAPDVEVAPPIAATMGRIERLARRRHAFARVRAHGTVMASGYTMSGEQRPRWSNGDEGEFLRTDIDSLPHCFELI